MATIFFADTQMNLNKDVGTPNAIQGIAYFDSALYGANLITALIGNYPEFAGAQSLYLTRSLVNNISVKSSGVWINGEPWVKVSGVWTLATEVWVKSGGVWMRVYG